MSYTTEIRIKCVVSNQWLVSAMKELNLRFGIPQINSSGNLEWKVTDSLTVMVKPKVTADVSLILYVISTNTLYDLVQQIEAVAPEMVPESFFKVVREGEKNQTPSGEGKSSKVQEVVRSIFDHPRFRTTIKENPNNE